MQDFLIQHTGELITALVAGFAGWFFQRKKQKAEQRGNEIDNAEKVLKYYREMIDDLGGRLQQAISELNGAKGVIKDLEEKVEALTEELKKYKQLTDKVAAHTREIKKLKNEQNSAT